MISRELTDIELKALWTAWLKMGWTCTDNETGYSERIDEFGAFHSYDPAQKLHTIKKWND